MQKHFYMTSSCTPFMIKRKATPVNKTSVIILECKEKQNCCENIYFNLCLFFDLLDVIHECFSFNDFFVCVKAIVCSDRLLSYYAIF